MVLPRHINLTTYATIIRLNFTVSLYNNYCCLLKKTIKSMVRSFSLLFTIKTNTSLYYSPFYPLPQLRNGSSNSFYYIDLAILSKKSRESYLTTFKILTLIYLL